MNKIWRAPTDPNPLHTNQEQESLAPTSKGIAGDNTHHFSCGVSGVGLCGRKAPLKNHTRKVMSRKRR